MSKIVSTLKHLSERLVDSDTHVRFGELPRQTQPNEASDVEQLGKLLTASGAVVALSGVAVDIIDFGPEQAASLVTLGGLGAAAIGAAVYGFEKLSNR